MKALRLSPMSRREEVYGALGPLQRLRLEFELRIPKTLLCRLQQTSRREVTVPASVELRLLQALRTHSASSCGCTRIAEWLGHGKSTTGADSKRYQCVSCENVPHFDSDSCLTSSPPSFTSSEAPSLLILRSLLRRGAYREAADLAVVLLRAGADPNEVDRDGRDLLSYSVQHLDDCITLTRILLNHGANVWSETSSVDGPDHSAFTWLLRALILRRRFENCTNTLTIIARVMGQAPQRMRGHVMRAMFRHARCPRVLGPIFQQLKLSLDGYWSKPQGLQYSCWSAVRQAVPPSQLSLGVSNLGLPLPLQKYILMED